jgi:hypothetical protein
MQDSSKLSQIKPYLMAGLYAQGEDYSFVMAATIAGAVVETIAARS